jgi:hypothetical protein
MEYDIDELRRRAEAAERQLVDLDKAMLEEGKVIAPLIVGKRYMIRLRFGDPLIGTVMGIGHGFFCLTNIYLQAYPMGSFYELCSQITSFKDMPVNLQHFDADLKIAMSDIQIVMEMPLKQDEDSADVEAQDHPVPD